MIKVNKPINLSQLDKEYNSQGLNGILDDDGNYIAVGLTPNNKGDESELKSIIEKHIAVEENWEYSTARKNIIEKLGLTQEEAKLLFS